MNEMDLSVERSTEIWCSETPSDPEDDPFLDTCRRSFLRRVSWIAVFLIAIVLVAGYSLGTGTVKIPFADCYGYVVDHVRGEVTNRQYDFIIVNSRLPRIAVSIIAGAGLAVCGVVMQSVLKNPMADPYTTGISSGAGFGATLAMTFGFTLTSGSYAIAVNAFVFSLIPLAAILAVSRMKGSSPTVIIMSGIAVMYIFNAVSTVLKLMANPDDLASLYRWSVGTVAGVSWDNILLMAVATAACIAAVQLLSRKLNIISMGDESAKALGLDVENMRMLLLVLVSVMVAITVSFTGLIGFVGLVAPHICRIFVGADNRYLVPASAAFGALLLLVSDLVGRTIISPATLQVGVVTAFIGGPMFLYLIIRQKRSAWR